MNLIELLPKEDKALMEQYIYEYGIGKESFVGLDAYLAEWAKSKTKLYRLLGNQFKVEIPYVFEKTDKLLAQELEGLLDTHPFCKKYDDFVEKYIIDVSDESKMYANNCVSVYMSNKLSHAVTIKLPEGGKKKEIRLQVGMKPLRALQKIVEGFPDFFSKEDFEDFRIKHSLCFNDKTIKGNLVISIHPFDFITMSDNACEWSSCMSWTDNGCYHVGTVEMMNSNNVVCVYITSDTPYYFSRKNENLYWNNKKWRQLIYVTKDIIVGGKAYPYRNKEITIKVLDSIRELAKNNLSWEYSYGPEKYLDMKHINHLNEMNQNKAWLANGESTKHNIIFDSKGMYNDMLNDNNTDYWCYRNKVKKMRIVSYSGKANCACCGTREVLNKSNYVEDYNDRYSNTESIVCENCFEAGLCTICDVFVGKNSLIKVPNSYDSICSRCAFTYYKICPCCGKTLVIPRGEKELFPGVAITEEEIFWNDFYDFNTAYYGRGGYFNNNYYKNYDKVTPYGGMKIIPIFMCKECIDKDLKNPNGLFNIAMLRRKYPSWANNSFSSGLFGRTLSKKVYTKEEILNHPILSKCLYANLKPMYEDK